MKKKEVENAKQLVRKSLDVFDKDGGLALRINKNSIYILLEYIDELEKQK